ncbi:MAG: sulfotransferase [Alphaproteobacteria bacterium]|nr:sulfotransferase [Alphaproteobacteria bacterium]
MLPGSPLLSETLPHVTAALEARDVALATDLAMAALAKGDEHPLLLNLRAFRFENEGRDAEALADLRRAATLAPNDPHIQNALGLSSYRNGQPGEALKAFEAAIALDPNFSQAVFNSGWVLEDIGELAAAEACFTRAHRMTPNAAAPLSRLAGVAVRRGDWAKAGLCAEKTLALEPHDALALQSLARVESEGGQLQQAEARLRGLLARPDLGPLDRAATEGQLGDVLDAQGRAADAFAAYGACNAIYRDANAPRYAAPGVETMPRYVAWLAEYFERAQPWKEEPRTADPDAPRHHVFIVGFPRSGTTLLENVLGSLPGAATTDETDGFVESVREFMTRPAGLDRLAGERDLGEFRAAYWKRMQSRGGAGGVFVDKLPYNAIKLPLIARLFPEARVVLMLRDPRDVVLSCFRQRFRMNPSSFELLTLDGAARFYDATMRLTEIYRARLPVKLHALRHEDLVSDFETQMTRLCAFLGIAFDESMRNFAGRARRNVVATPSGAQLLKGLNAQGVGQWRRYADEMAPVLATLDPWVTRFGYDTDGF